MNQFLSIFILAFLLKPYGYAQSTVADKDVQVISIKNITAGNDGVTLQLSTTNSLQSAPLSFRKSQQNLARTKLISPLSIKQGGSSGVGGGSGTLCAHNENAIWALEYWTAANLGQSNFFPTEPQDQTWRDYLWRVLNLNYGKTNPEFLQTLWAFIEAVDPEQWNDEEIPLVADLGPVFQRLEERIQMQGCRRVQIARRDDFVLTNGERVSRLTYNKKLFNNLGTTSSERIVNQATLILHEAVYWLHEEINKSGTSNDTQYFIHSILNPAVYSGPAHRQKLRIEKLDAFFKIGVESRSQQAQSRTASYINLVRLMNQAYTENGLMLNHGAKAESIDWRVGTNALYLIGALTFIDGPAKWSQGKIFAVQETLYQKVLPQLTNQEAFILVASDYAALQPRNNFQFESLFFDGMNGQSEFKRICQAIRSTLSQNSDDTQSLQEQEFVIAYKTSFTKDKWEVPLLKKAWGYCSNASDKWP